MRWPEVVTVLLDTVEADPVLSGIFGVDIYRAGDRKLKVPALEYTIISDTEEENFNPLRIQWDVFVRMDADLVAAERRLRRLFHHDLPTEIGGITMWAEYVARQDMQGLMDGIRGSSTDFRFTPVRSRYVWAGSES
jgi:hypothetical protein